MEVLEVHAKLANALVAIDNGHEPNIGPILAEHVHTAVTNKNAPGTAKLVAVDGAAIYIASLRRNNPVIPYGIKTETDSRFEFVQVPLMVLPDIAEMPIADPRQIFNRTLAEFLNLCREFENGIYFSFEGREILASFDFIEPLIKATSREVINTARFEMQFVSNPPDVDVVEESVLKAFIANKREFVSSIDLAEVEVFNRKYFVVVINFKEDTPILVAADIKSEAEDLTSDTHQALLLLHEFGEPSDLGSGVIRLEGFRGTELPGLYFPNPHPF